MSNLLTDLFAKAKQQRKPISYYTNQDDTDMFSVGLVVAYDDQYILTYELSLDGSFDGYSLQAIRNIYRVDIDDSYTQELIQPTGFPNTLLENLTFDNDNDCVFDKTIHYLFRSDLHASFSCNQKRQVEFEGKITKITDEFLRIEVYAQGKADGMIIVRQSSISMVTWNNQLT